MKIAIFLLLRTWLLLVCAFGGFIVRNTPPLGIEVSNPAASLHHTVGFHSESPSCLGVASGSATY